MFPLFLRISCSEFSIVVRHCVRTPNVAYLGSSSANIRHVDNARLGTIPCLNLTRLRQLGPLSICNHHRNIYSTTGSHSRSQPGIFTPSKKGVEVPFVIKPDLNLETLFGSECPELKRSLAAHGKETLNLQEMIKMWKDLKALDAERSKIESARQGNKKLAKELSRRKASVDSREIESHRQEGKKLRESLKLVNAQIGTLRDRLYPAALSLPNLLHPDVPVGSKNKVREEIPVSSGSEEGQFALHGKKGSISKNHSLFHLGACYLQGDIPQTEQRLLNHAEEFFHQRGLNQLSCPDMIKPYMLDALGQDYKERDEVYHIEGKESDMCLTGLSPLNFYAYYMMSVIEANDLPERCFSIGQSYNAQDESFEFKGLHRHFQGSQVQLFSLFQSSVQEEAAQFDGLMSLLKDFYRSLGVQFRVVDTASQNLIPAVHRRRAIEVWLPSTESYQEVADVSSCTDYVSRRLMIRYPRNPLQSAVESRDRKYAYSIHGTALNCNVLLESLLGR